MKKRLTEERIAFALRQAESGTAVAAAATGDELPGQCDLHGAAGGKYVSGPLFSQNGPETS